MSYTEGMKVVNGGGYLMGNLSGSIFRNFEVLEL